MKTTNRLCFECRSSTCTQPNHDVIYARDYRIPPKRDERTWKKMEAHYEETGFLLMWDKPSSESVRNDNYDALMTRRHNRHIANDLKTMARELQAHNHHHDKCMVMKTAWWGGIDHYRVIPNVELHNRRFAYKRDYFEKWRVIPVSRTLIDALEPCEEHN